MPRGGWKRTWIKLYPVDCLDGSIRYQLEADERGVWYDMLNFSAVCSEPGVVADKDGRPYPHDFIANRLNIPLELFERTLKKCNEEGRTFENDNGIHITNWAAYQSEYQRQKPYRERKREGKKVHKVCAECGFKAITDETYCPKCAEEGKEIEMKKDYSAGKYAHLVER